MAGTFQASLISTKDLSLLTHHSLADIEALQSVGKDSAKQEFILRNDTDAVWNILKNLNDGRIDFVLDNCMFLRILTFIP